MRKLFLGILVGSLLTSNTVSACKMSTMSGSVSKLRAILENIEADSSHTNSDIIEIKQIGRVADNKYVIKIKVNNLCQAFVYQANIDPSCKVDVKQISKLSKC